MDVRIGQRPETWLSTALALLVSWFTFSVNRLMASMIPTKSNWSNVTPYSIDRLESLILNHLDHSTPIDQFNQPISKLDQFFCFGRSVTFQMI